MFLRIDGKLITSLTMDELGATLQQIAAEMVRRKHLEIIRQELAVNVMEVGTILRRLDWKGR